MNQGFGKQYRLLKTEEFSSVFALRKQVNSPFLNVLYSRDNALGHARLGLVVSKKVAKRANRRNLMKRTIREWFRQHKNELPARDFVVRVRVGFVRADGKQIRAELARLLLRPETR
ncbi:MAG: ribonuclease P protein component [Neisseria sp.]|nr:ribonuclease P protein component [Neisseria sp.]